MTEVEDYIYSFEQSQREVMLYLHRLLSEELDLTAKIRYKIPFYYRKSWICYLNPIKEKSIEFAFVRGNELSNTQGLLNNKGRKQVYSLELTDMASLPTKEINELIQEAIILDDTVPYASKRKGNP
jgi:hypothetical protein